MDDTPNSILVRKLQNNGMALDIAASEVQKVMAMSPSGGAENLQKLGLDYLASFKLLSLAAKDDDSDRASEGGGLFSVLFPRRLTRGEYLVRYVFFIVGLILASAYPAFQMVRHIQTNGIIPAVFILLVLLYKIVVLDAARFRDRGKTGFFAFFMILPAANVIAQVYLWFAR
jgi:hypothetical protein